MNEPGSRISVIRQSNFKAYRRHLGTPGPVFFAEVRVKLS